MGKKTGRIDAAGLREALREAKALLRENKEKLPPTKRQRNDKSYAEAPAEDKLTDISSDEDSISQFTPDSPRRHDYSE